MRKDFKNFFIRFDWW